MAKEELKTTGAQPKGKAVKRTDEKPGFFERTKKWFRDMKSELKKIVWPTPKTFGKNTAVALVMMAASAIVIWGFDTIASLAVKTLIMWLG